MTPSPYSITTDREPIAIIGIGCRFPGGIDSPESFWRLVLDGINAIGELPEDRASRFYSSQSTHPAEIALRPGGYLKNIEHFDPDFFGISPREAATMDPQQRLLLEVAWEALADAGQVTSRLAASRTGVFVGMWVNDFEDYLYSTTSEIDFHMTTGSSRYAAAGRVSYFLNLQGPSLVVDTACSSSLVAVHLACQSLRSRECNLALAGGANLILQPQITGSYARTKMLSPDYRCKFGDERADGYVRSEGIGLVVLKPLSQALADRDPIYALIRGSAVNNDGAGSGSLVAPSRDGQEALLREAYRDAAISPGEVHYIEAHGTGTRVGDPTELGALGAVVGEGRAKDSPCVVGSVKTNIGHTEGAAGVAGLIKTALCLKHRRLPASLHFESPASSVPWNELPIVIQREGGPWPVDSTARAGVSSFGISGTNAHVVLEEAPTMGAAVAVPVATVVESLAETDAYLLPISARSETALRELAAAYVPLLRNTEGTALRDLCYTAALRRSHHEHRLALAAHNGPELAQQLEAFLQGEPPATLALGQAPPALQPKPVFVFSGQGGQWLGMGRQLLAQEPVFRQTLEQCDELLRSQDKLLRSQVDWSLIEELQATEAGSQLAQIDVVQPLLFAMQVALAELWRSWGVQPAAVVGHSMGELAAAHVAGILTLADALRIICVRSKLLKRLSGQGAMAVVELSFDEATEAIAEQAHLLAVAVSNSRRSTVLSGDPAALTRLLHRLEAESIFCRLVKADVAGHSPQVDPLLPELREALAALEPQAGRLRMQSTVSAESISGSELTVDYWLRNLREPVRFATAIERLTASGHNLFIEISPHPVLLPPISEVAHEQWRQMAHPGPAPVVVASLRRDHDERLEMLHALAQLYCVGQPVDWSHFFPGGGRCVTLPAYPWQRQRYWLNEDEKSNGQRQRQGAGRRSSSGHPLLGPHLRLASDTRTHLWETELGLEPLPYLSDHRVQQLAVLPATAYIELTLAAAREAFGPGPHALEQLSFKKLLALPEEGEQRVQLAMAPELDGRFGFQIYSQESSADPTTNGNGNWTLHASGHLRLASGAEAATEAPAAEPLTAIQARCPVLHSGQEHYQIQIQHGLQYGPSFQGVDQVWLGEGEALGRLVTPPAVAAQAGRYQLHPALLDSCLQVMSAASQSVSSQLGLDDSSPYLPVEMAAIRCWNRPGTELWAHARLRLSDTAAFSSATNGDHGPAESLLCDLTLFQDNGELVAEVRGLRTQRLPRQESGSESETLQQWLHQPHWLPQPLPERVSAKGNGTGGTPGTWLLFADRRGVAEHLQQELQLHGQHCLIVYPGPEFQASTPDAFLVNPDCPDHFKQLFAHLQSATLPPCRAVVHLWSLADTATAETTIASLEKDHLRLCAGLLHLTQALAEHDEMKPRVWLVTENAQPAESTQPALSLQPAPLLGMARVIANEHPQWRCSRVDLSAASVPDNSEGAALFAELWSETEEDEVALRGQTRYVARLGQSTTATANSPAATPVLTPAEGRPFRLEIASLGILDSLVLRPCARPEPGPCEVELEVAAAGLNFLDVLSAMGIYPGQSGDVLFGVECAGRITAIGPDVEEWSIGDEVLTVGSSTLASHVITATTALMRKPPQLSFEQAAGIPIVFATAHYALNHLAHLSAGERVLIHAASGGVGLAAIQLAQLAGAEIWATAGSPRKREFLQQLGVKHVMDSRSLDFAEQVLQGTGGAGVDVVLNSLSGDAIARNLEVLAPYGRFLEIGKRDIYQNAPLGLWPFQKNLSYFAIDLRRIFGERPLLCHRLLSEVAQLFADGQLQPLPVEAFSIADAADAFRHMAQAKHIGKLVLRVKDEPVMLAAPTTAAPSLPDSLSPNGCYLISGGLGGLGLEVAHWLVARGARQLVLLSRSGPQTEAHAAALARLQQAGAQVLALAADVADPEALQKVLAQLQQLPWGPLRGIVHVAGVLDDGILQRLDASRFQPVLRPKVAGAWNLHLQTLDAPLDFFVMFSSVASLLGNAGQANYAAANAFLDSLAHHRRALDRPALSINWSPWAEIGDALRPERGERLTERGLQSIKPGQALKVLDRVFTDHLPPQISVFALEVHRWCQFYPAANSSSLLAEMRQLQSASDSNKQTLQISEALLAVEPGPGRRMIMEKYIQEQIGKVLRIAPSRIGLNVVLRSLGIDSLMSIELRNRLESGLGLALKATIVWTYPTVTSLASHLAEQMGISLEPAPGEVTSTEQEKSGPLESLKRLDGLTADQLKVLLTEKLNTVEQVN
jgi:acyl transferase domain-containing protein/acyl carrier protein